MALNFEQAKFVDPKIQIAPRELPVEEMMKVGNVLQDRFDKAMENETKTSFALKKLEESANPLDRETARIIRENTQKRLTDRATNGRYQDMQWQTQQDAMEAASNYEALANRNKEIQKYSDYITTDKGITDPARKQYELEKWMKSQNKTSYDLNNRTLTGLDISAPSLVADVDMAKFFESHGQGIQANLIGRTNKNEKVFQKGEILPNGQTAPGLTVYNVATNTQRSGVTPERVKNVVMGYANADAGIKAYMGSVADYYQNKLGMTKEQADFKAYNDIIESNLKPTINKYAYTHDVRGNEMGLDVAASNYYGGSGVSTNPFELNFNHNLNGVDVTKEVEPLIKQKQEVVSTMFNSDGSRKIVEVKNPSQVQLNQKSQELLNSDPGKYNRITNFKEQYHILQQDALKALQSGTGITPTAFEIAYKKNNPTIGEGPNKRPTTDKDAYEAYMDAKVNRAKLAMAQYDISSASLDKLFSHNMNRTFSTMPFFKADGTREEDPKVIEEGLKGSLHFIPMTGQIITNNGLSLAAGYGGRGMAPNKSAEIMAKTSDMLKAALDPDKSFDTTEGKEYSIGGKRFRIIKNQYSPEGGKYKYIGDNIQEIGQDGKVVGRYMLDNQGLNKFVQEQLTDVIAPYSEQ
jgi:hypothetical protein